MPLICWFFLIEEVGKQHILWSIAKVKALIAKIKIKTTIWHSRWRMFLCSSSSAVGLWLSRLKEEKKRNYFYTVLSLLSSSAKVGQISEKWHSKFYRTCTSTVLSFRGGTLCLHLFLPGEGGADLCPNSLPLLPALPGEARLSWGLIISAAPLLDKPVTVWSTRPAAELQSQRVLPLHPAGQSTWTQAKINM